MDILATICCFMRLDALLRLRQTCKTLRAALIHAWNVALFVPSGKWYELKDVALAAKYMSWTGRVPSSPPTLDTMDNIAFWGTLVDGDRLLATIGPNVLTFETDLQNDMLSLNWVTSDMEYTWVDTKTKQEYTTQLDESKFDYYEGSVMFFSKQCQIKMYAVVKLTSGVGLYQLISEAVQSDYYWHRDSKAKVSPTELFFNDPNGHLSVDADLAYFFLRDRTPHGFTRTREWYDEHDLASPTKRLEMETALIQSAANAGRGWNSTRRDVLEQFVAQLH